MDFTDVRFENFDLENQKLQDYDVSANEFQLKNQNRSSVINMGLKLTFERYWRPFALKYHAPCAIIVIVCHISYFVPPNIAPARIGLLVTNFLALSNIFTSHQVLKTWINIIFNGLWHNTFAFRQKLPFQGRRPHLLCTFWYA